MRPKSLPTAAPFLEAGGRSVPPEIPVPPDYSNPQLPDDVNVSDTHPLANFARLLGGIVVVIVAVHALALAAGWLAGYLPFATEASVAHRFESQFVEVDTRPTTVTVQRYLEQFTARVAARRANCHRA